MKRPHKLRIGVDALGVLPREIGGGTTYVRELARALDASPDLDHEIVAFTTPLSSQLFEGMQRVRVIEQKLPANHRSARLLFEQLVLPGLARHHQVDVMHFPGNIQALWMRGTPTVLTVHDLSSHFYQETFGDRSARVRLQRRLLDHSCRRADLIVVDSEFSRQEVVSRLGADLASRTEVVYLGSPRPRPEIIPVAVPDLVGVTFFLYVGGTARHKNVDGLIRGWAAFTRDRPEAVLVIAGNPGTGHEEVLAAIGETGAASTIRLLGYAAEPQLEWLYLHARAVVVPSLYEGFGLPVLEAMQRQSPVITSAAGSLPEVAGDAALYVEPLDPTTFATAFRRILLEPGLSQSLIARGDARISRFTWDKTAARMLDLFRGFRR